jgi:hypothetical protein
VIVRLAMLLALATTLAACDLVGAVDTYAEPCPDENYGLGDGYDPLARDCIWKAFTDGKAASFKTTKITPQRDPIVTRVTVRPGGKIEVFYDNSLDTFSTQTGKYNLTCTKFQRSVDPGTGRIRFLADSCRGANIPALVF